MQLTAAEMMKSARRLRREACTSTPWIPTWR